jgi:hypothetical protein
MLRLGFALAVTPTLAVRAESRAASAVRATTTPVLDGRVDENGSDNV